MDRVKVLDLRKDRREFTGTIPEALDYLGIPKEEQADIKSYYDLLEWLHYTDEKNIYCDPVYDSIYDVPIEAILNNDGWSKEEIRRLLKGGGASVYTIDDYVRMMEDEGFLADFLINESCTKEEYVKMLKSGYHDGDGVSVGIIYGMEYVIEYPV